MNYLLLPFLFIFAIPTMAMAQGRYTSLSTDLIENLMTDQPVDSLVSLLESADRYDLADELDTDAKKKTFWINVYNGFIQICLSENPELFQNRSSFFKQERLIIAGEDLSFEEIEHGILRHSKSPIGLGFLPKLFPNDFEKMMRVESVDPRIHCALNCGAASCPPVAPLQSEMVESQLDTYTRKYMSKSSHYNPEENTIYVPKLLSWFTADWGSQKDKRQWLKKYGVLPADAHKPDIAYTDYDWTLELNNYIRLEGETK